MPARADDLLSLFEIAELAPDAVETFSRALISGHIHEEPWVIPTPAEIANHKEDIPSHALTPGWLSAAAWERRLADERVDWQAGKVWLTSRAEFNPRWIVPRFRRAAVMAIVRPPGRPSRSAGKFSSAAAIEWYKRRVKNWPDELPPPSREDDLKAAKNEFNPAITVTVVRSLRSDHAPEHWKAQGRRKLATK